jgi:hypothetical protein
MHCAPVWGQRTNLTRMRPEENPAERIRTAQARRMGRTEGVALILPCQAAQKPRLPCHPTLCKAALDCSGQEARDVRANLSNA